MDPTKTYTVKSLLKHLTTSQNTPSPLSYEVTRAEKYPRKFKLFCWELNHKAINTQDRIQRRLPKIALSPNGCIMYYKEAESQDHLFVTCEFANRFWRFVIEVFYWQTPLHANINTLLQATLGDTHSKKQEDYVVTPHQSFLMELMERKE